MNLQHAPYEHNMIPVDTYHVMIYYPRKSNITFQTIPRKIACNNNTL